MELKKPFAAKLESEGYQFLKVGKSVADEEKVKLMRLHVGSWHKVVVEQTMSRVSPVEFKYNFSVGTPIVGNGAPVLRVASDAAGNAGPNSEGLVLAVEVRVGEPDPQPPGMCGYPIPHIATSMEAIASYYAKLKLR